MMPWQSSLENAGFGKTLAILAEQHTKTGCFRRCSPFMVANAPQTNSSSGRSSWRFPSNSYGAFILDVLPLFPLMVSGHASFGHNRSMEHKTMFLTSQPSQPSQPMQLNQDLILFPIQLGKCPIPQKCMSAIDCTLKDRNVECMITLRYKHNKTMQLCQEWTRLAQQLIPAAVENSSFEIVGFRHHTPFSAAPGLVAMLTQFI